MIHCGQRVGIASAVASGVIALGFVAVSAVVSPAAMADTAVVTPSAIEVYVDDGVTAISSGVTDTYSVRIVNHGKNDLVGLKVSVNFDSPFVVLEAQGSKNRRSSIATWESSVAAGKDVVLTATGRLDAIPENANVMKVTGCAFLSQQLSPVACNSDFDKVVRAPAGTSMWTVFLICLATVAGEALLVLLVLLALYGRRRRRRASGAHLVEPLTLVEADSDGSAAGGASSQREHVGGTPR